VTVEISTGELFKCAIKLRILDRISLDHSYDDVLGRDWYMLCFTGLENNPDAVVHFLSQNKWLIFASSTVDAVHARCCFITDSKITRFLPGIK
jgi:hypothetical protein